MRLESESGIVETLIVISMVMLMLRSQRSERRPDSISRPRKNRLVRAEIRPESQSRRLIQIFSIPKPVPQIQTWFHPDLADAVKRFYRVVGTGVVWRWLSLADLG